MTTQQIISDLVELNNLLNKELDNNNPLLHKAEQENQWFTQENIRYAIQQIQTWLNAPALTQWISKYTFPKEQKNKTVGIILSGNIPLVGFHDLLCVLISGNKALVKLSHKDKALYQLIYNLLNSINPEYSNKITFTENILKNIDAIIATGSNNSARYFEYYFGKYPNIIRKNRNTVAVLSNNTSVEDIKLLANDLFLYFGLGCRNASLLFVPTNFDFNILFEGLTDYQHIINHNKYANNYNYQKTIYAMNGIPYYDNGFCLFTENKQTYSPIGVINYAFYNNYSEIDEFIELNKNQIQCVISKDKLKSKIITFSDAQKPMLNDYADNIDTLQFLLNL